MIGFIRVSFFVLPVMLFVWYMVYTDNFMATAHKVNSLQGRNGLIVINDPGKPTLGNHFTEFLDENFGNQVSVEWRRFFTRSGRDLDFVIRKIEDYWVWMIASILLLSAAAMLYAFRNYK